MASSSGPRVCHGFGLWSLVQRRASSPTHLLVVWGSEPKPPDNPLPDDSTRLHSRPAPHPISRGNSRGNAFEERGCATRREEFSRAHLGWPVLIWDPLAPRHHHRSHSNCTITPCYQYARSKHKAASSASTRSKRRRSSGVSARQCGGGHRRRCLDSGPCRPRSNPAPDRLG